MKKAIVNFYRKRKVYILLFLFFLILYTVYLEKVGGEMGYRYLDLSYSFSEGKLDINDLHDNTVDKAYFNDHYYSAIAPGFPVIGAIIFYVSKPFYNLLPSSVIENTHEKIKDYYVQTKRFESEGPFLTSIDLGYFFVVSTVVVFITGPVLSSLFMVFLYYFLQRIYGKKQKHLILSIVALGAGSILWFYTITHHAHVPSTFAFILSFYFLWSYYKRKTKSDLFLSGLFGGIMLFMNFSIAIVVVPLALYFFLKEKQQKSDIKNTLNKTIVICGGIIIFLVPLLLYNFLIFGNPLSFPHNYVIDQIADSHEEGFLGLTYPKIAAIFHLLITPFRGVFFYQLWAMLSVIGCINWYKKGKREEAIFILLSVILLTLFTASYSAWHGHWSFGPRHLIPIIPLLVLTMPSAIETIKKKIIPYILIVLSVFINWLGVQYGLVTMDYKNPIFQYYIPTLFSTGLQTNLTQYAIILFEIPQLMVMLINWLLFITLILVLTLILINISNEGKRK